MVAKKPAPRLTHQGLLVLRVMAKLRDAELCGADLMKVTGFSSGTLYPILFRFERAGLLDSRWEEERPRDLKRPRKRLYSITAAGRAFAQDAFEQLSLRKLKLAAALGG